MLPKRLGSASKVALAVACALAVGGSLISGCGDMAGPLQTLAEQGQPVVDSAGIPAAPGQPVDGTAFVFNSSHQPVTLVSASIVPVPGYPAGVLAHIGVGTTLNMVGIGTNWPPAVPVGRFRGAILSYGESRIIFGFTGYRAGANYGAAGIRITYTYQGRDFSIIAWSGLMGCVTQPLRQRHAAAHCNSLSNRFLTAVRKVAGLG